MANEYDQSDRQLYPEYLDPLHTVHLPPPNDGYGRRPLQDTTNMLRTPQSILKPNQSGDKRDLLRANAVSMHQQLHPGTEPLEYMHTSNHWTHGVPPPKRLRMQPTPPSADHGAQRTRSLRPRTRIGETSPISPTASAQSSFDSYMPVPYGAFVPASPLHDLGYAQGIHSQFPPAFMPNMPNMPPNQAPSNYASKQHPKHGTQNLSPQLRPRSAPRAPDAFSQPQLVYTAPRTSRHSSSGSSSFNERIPSPHGSPFRSRSSSLSSQTAQQLRQEPLIDDGQKPTLSYAMLIGLAIVRSPQRRLTLAQIYDWIMRTFSYYRETGPAWHNSIRHNLSLNKAFVKRVRPKSDPGKGNYWEIAEGQEEQFLRPKFAKKLEAQRQHQQKQEQEAQQAQTQPPQTQPTQRQTKQSPQNGPKSVPAMQAMQAMQTQPQKNLPNMPNMPNMPMPALRAMNDAQDMPDMQSFHTMHRTSLPYLNMPPLPAQGYRSMPNSHGSVKPSRKTKLQHSQPPNSHSPPQPHQKPAFCPDFGHQRTESAPTPTFSFRYTQDPRSPSAVSLSPTLSAASPFSSHSFIPHASNEENKDTQVETQSTEEHSDIQSDGTEPDLQIEAELAANPSSSTSLHVSPILAPRPVPVSEMRYPLMHNMSQRAFSEGCIQLPDEFVKMYSEPERRTVSSGTDTSDANYTHKQPETSYNPVSALPALRMRSQTPHVSMHGMLPPLPPSTPEKTVSKRRAPSITPYASRQRTPQAPTPFLSLDNIPQLGIDVQTPPAFAPRRPHRTNVVNAPPPNSAELQLSANLGLRAAFQPNEGSPRKLFMTPVRQPFDTPIRDLADVFSPYKQGPPSFGSPR